MKLKEIKSLKTGSKIFAVIIDMNKSPEVRPVEFLREAWLDICKVEDKREIYSIDKKDLFLTEKEAYRVLIERYEDSIAKSRRNIESHEAQIIEWKKKIREKE